MLAQIPTLLAQHVGMVASSTMINLGTLIAQVVNFLILVLLLRYFLYGRIVGAMDRREKKIASHFEAAEQKEQDAAKLAEKLQHQNAKFDEQRESMLAEARQQVDEQRQDLMRKARDEVHTQAGRWREDLERDKQAFLQEIRDKAGRQICAMVRQALGDLADTEIERAMVGVLIRRLAELSPDGRRELTEAMASDGRGLVVATAWDLPEDDRKKATEAVQQHLINDAKIQFETVPELICGIKLRAGGREISWTIASYIEGIQQQLAETIDQTIAVESQRTRAEADAPSADGQVEREPSDE